jgi:glutaredoxin
MTHPEAILESRDRISRTGAAASLSAFVHALRLHWLFVVWLCLALAGASACRKKTVAAAETAPEAPVITASTSGLEFTWIDEKGGFHTEYAVAEVPAEGREAVRVRDMNKDPSDRGLVFIADLRTPGPDGTFPVRAVPVLEFEDLAVARRAKVGAVLTPRTAPSAAASTVSAAPDEHGGAGVGTRSSVIIYGASWCGPCHQAAAYFKERGVPFVEHDIEKDASAAREMQSKLAKAGKSGGSIPVLDVRGHILIGFDAHAVDRALASPL